MQRLKKGWRHYFLRAAALGALLSLLVLPPLLAQDDNAAADPAAGAKIAGQIHLNSEGAQGEDQRGFPAIGLLLYREDNLDTPVAKSETDAYGRYQFQALADGTYYITLSIPGQPYTLSNSRAGTVAFWENDKDEIWSEGIAVTAQGVTGVDVFLAGAQTGQADQNNQNTANQPAAAPDAIYTIDMSTVDAAAVAGIPGVTFSSPSYPNNYLTFDSAADGHSYVLIGSTTTCRLLIEEDVTIDITLQNCSLSPRSISGDTSPMVNVRAGADLTLYLQGSNAIGITSGSSDYQIGIHVAPTAFLTVDGDGELSVSAGRYAAVIGGADAVGYYGCGTLRFIGGKTTCTNNGTTSTAGAAVIGSGSQVAGYDGIYIGGTAEVYISSNGAVGLGASVNNQSTCGEIAVTGGKLQINGSAWSPCIFNSNAVKVQLQFTMTGGEVILRSSGTSSGGIGGSSTNMDISITGGTFTANTGGICIGTTGTSFEENNVFKIHIGGDAVVNATSSSTIAIGALTPFGSEHDIIIDGSASVTASGNTAAIGAGSSVASVEPTCVLTLASTATLEAFTMAASNTRPIVAKRIEGDGNVVSATVTGFSSNLSNTLDFYTGGALYKTVAFASDYYGFAFSTGSQTLDFTARAYQSGALLGIVTHIANGSQIISSGQSAETQRLTITQARTVTVNYVDVGGASLGSPAGSPFVVLNGGDFTIPIDSISDMHPAFYRLTTTGTIKYSTDNLVLTVTQDTTVTVCYASTVVEMSFPEEMLFYAYPSDGGTVTSADFTVTNNSEFPLKISFTQMQTDTALLDGINVTDNASANGDLALQIGPKSGVANNGFTSGTGVLTPNTPTLVELGTLTGVISDTNNRKSGTLVVGGSYIGKFPAVPKRPAVTFVFQYELVFVGEG